MDDIEYFRGSIGNCCWSQNIKGCLSRIENCIISKFPSSGIWAAPQASREEEGCNTLSEYIREYKSACDQLNAIGKPVPDERKVFFLLNGLGPRYETFSTAMLEPPVPSHADLIPLSQSHELRYKSHFSENDNPNLSFVSQRQAYRTQYKRGPSSFSSKGCGFIQTNRKAHHLVLVMVETLLQI